MNRVLAIALFAPAFSVPAYGEVLDVRYLDAETVNLTEVGMIDWCVFRLDNSRQPTYPAAEWKRAGRGITRNIRIRGTSKRRWTSQTA